VEAQAKCPRRGPAGGLASIVLDLPGCERWS